LISTFYLEKKIGYKLTMQLGLVGIGIFGTLAGPFPFLYIPHAIWPLLVSMTMCGFFEAFGLVPCISEILRVHSKYDEEELIDKSVALFTACYSFGDMLANQGGNILYI
jgi:sugar phosphate permease